MLPLTTVLPPLLDAPCVFPVSDDGDRAPELFPESRDTLVASVEVLLATLAELASIELSVDARLCFDVLRLRTPAGVDAGPRPGLSVDFGDGTLRPRNRDAATLTASDVRTAPGPPEPSCTGGATGAGAARFDSL